MKKRIVLDIDGILSGFNLPAHAVLSQHCAMTPFPETGPEMWDWFTYYGATKTACAELSKAMHTDEFWWGLPLHADVNMESFTLVEELDRSHELSFVTARPMGRWITQQWLTVNFPIVGDPSVVITPHHKVHALLALEPAVIIEDSSRNLLDFAAAERDYHLPKCEKILVSRPYNTIWHANCRAVGITIVDSTNDALRLAEKVASNA